MERLGSVGVDVFSVVLIVQVDNNKDCFEDTDCNKIIHNLPLAAPPNAIDKMKPLSALDVSGFCIILNILL